MTILHDKSDISENDPLYVLTMPELRRELEAQQAAQAAKFDLEDELLREFEEYDKPKLPVADAGSEALRGTYGGTADLIEELENSIQQEPTVEALLKQAISKAYPEHSDEEVDAEVHDALEMIGAGKVDLEEFLRNYRDLEVSRPLWLNEPQDPDLEREIGEFFAPGNGNT